MADGPGFRTAIYCAGCKHGCKGCHNPQSWDFKAGKWVEVDDLLSLIKADSTRNGGNIGWDKVKDHVTKLNIFGGGVGGPVEIWVDDITIYGVKDVD
jgi:pyruvate-formate lyase-activating enzyme